MHIRNAHIINDYNVERLALRFMLWSFGALGLAYVLILGNMVFNIVERKSLEKESLALSSEVSDMELSYLSISNNIDLNYSHALGFKETNIKFATRKALGYKSADIIGGSLKTLNTENEI